MDNALKLNVAYKTIQIMGQILRNFPGSLRGNIKLELARETYLVGVRTLKMITKAMQTETDLIRALIRGYLTEKRGLIDEATLNRLADNFLFWLGVSWGGAVIQHVSYSVGSDQLAETYKEMMEAQETIPLRLLDISIKLEHFDLPVAEILELNKELDLEGNIYGQTLLKSRVLFHFYLYAVNRNKRQQLCEKLQIEIKPKAFQSETKK